MYLTQKEPKEGYKYWYLEESKHTEKGTRKSFSMFLGKPERIYGLVQRPLNRLVLSTHNFGMLAALLHGVEELRLGEILEEEVTLEGQADMSPAQRLVMILGARYERPASKLETVAEWYENSMLRILWKCRPPHVNTVYETMDCLTSDVRRRVKERLRNRLLELGERPRCLIWDTTNFYTYGGPDGLRRHGRSKDGKHRHPLVGMGILTSERDIPLAQIVFPGNRHDKNVFEKALPTLLCLAEDIAEDPKDVTIVFDRGCNDGKLIEKIEKISHCVGSLKRNQDPANLLQTPIDELDHLYDTEKKHEVRGLKTRGEAFGRQMTLVVKYHEGTAARQRKVLKHHREKALELCPDLEERVGSGRGRPFTPQGIQDRMDKLQEAEEAIDWSFDEEKQVFSWSFNNDKWERLLAEAGKSLLFTTHKEWEAKDIIKAYEGKWRVEHSFRLLKGSIPVRPVYHGRDDRIREHCFLMYLLIVIHRYLMEQLREPVLEEFEIGEETIHRLLKELRLITSKPSDTNKPEFVVEERGAIENAVIRSLNLERFIPGADRHEL